MSAREYTVEHDADLAPAIVWDAFVDPVLVGGWLGEAEIDPLVGGRYRLGCIGSRDRPAPERRAVDGVIVEWSAGRRLTVATGETGGFSVSLDGRPGGSRGEWTRVRVTLTAGPDAEVPEPVRDGWSLALSRLDELLRGHPFDWNAPAIDPDSRTDARTRDTGTTHAGDAGPASAPTLRTTELRGHRSRGKEQ